jgi:hypothetical protein
MTRKFLEAEDSGDGVIFRLLFGEESSGGCLPGEMILVSPGGDSEFILEQDNREVNVDKPANKRED